MAIDVIKKPTKPNGGLIVSKKGNNIYISVTKENGEIIKKWNKGTFMKGGMVEKQAMKIVQQKVLYFCKRTFKFVAIKMKGLGLKVSTWKFGRLKEKKINYKVLSVYNGCRLKKKRRC